MIMVLRQSTNRSLYYVAGCSYLLLSQYFFPICCHASFIASYCSYNNSNKNRCFRNDVMPPLTLSIGESNNNNNNNNVNENHDSEKDNEQRSSKISDSLLTSFDMKMNRRNALFQTAAVGAATAMTLMSPVNANELENVELGTGQWIPQQEQQSTSTSSKSKKIQIPPLFVTYLARFLIVYDSGVSEWYNNLMQSYSLLPEEQQNRKLSQNFASFAYSLNVSLNQFILQQQQQSLSSFSVSSAYEQFANLLLDKYQSSQFNTDDSVKRHIGILMALLPPKEQPIQFLQRQYPTTTTTTTAAGKNTKKDNSTASHTTTTSNKPSNSKLPQNFGETYNTLLPQDYTCVRDNNDQSQYYFTVRPKVSSYTIGISEEFGQTAVATMFGPLSTTSVLSRDIPSYTPWIYTLFGISGATGCALTHTIVIPLDVVKTRSQTNPVDFEGKNLLQGAVTIWKQDNGAQGLLLGAQATIAGYFWYGLSVYPSYTFFKRFITHSLAPELVTVHVNDIALIAGALAAVVASIGLTPLEAARIRVVAEPSIYKPLGLTGTLQQIATEDETKKGWKAVYAGFPSLLTRQVIFGSVKFLAFERACEVIYDAWPNLRDLTWTALTVSLVAGGISGCISSIVSQPADSVLTYVAQQKQSSNDGVDGTMGVLQGSRLMIEQDGIGSLFRGVGSRCVWAGSIIAGQFLLYDVFRTYFGVSTEDLTQVYQVMIS